MKKRDLKKLALLGLASGCLINAQAQALEGREAEKQLISNEELMLIAAAKNPNKSCAAQKSSAQKFVADSEKPKTSTEAVETTFPQDPNSQNLGYHLMTEQELLNELNDEGIKLYKGLDAEGKELARKVASQRCNGSNECKGLNACQTEHNKCAGQGSCKGKSKCALSDKNLAVKLVAKKMAEKRGNSLKN